jgi:hypothetical protein
LYREEDIADLQAHIPQKGNTTLPLQISFSSHRRIEPKQQSEIQPELSAAG